MTATAMKTSVKKCVSAASNLITRIPSCSIPQKLVNFSRLNSKGLYQISEKEKGGCCLEFSASTKRCSRATTAKKCTKLLFCQSKPIAFLPSSFSLPSP